MDVETTENARNREQELEDMFSEFDRPAVRFNHSHHRATPLSRQQVAEIIQCYKQGEEPNHLRIRFHIGYQRLKAILAQAGVTTRPLRAKKPSTAAAAPAPVSTPKPRPQQSSQQISPRPASEPRPGRNPSYITVDANRLIDLENACIDLLIENRELKLQASYRR